MSRLITVPEFILHRTLLNTLKFLRTDYDAQSDKSKSYIMKLVAELGFEKYEYTKQVVAVFLSTNEDPRHLSIDLAFNMQKENPPSIHIVMPSETPGQNSLSSGEGGQDNHVNYSDTEVPVAETYQSVFSRRYNTTYDIVILSDNSNEIVMIYHILKSLLVALSAHLTLSGLENLTFAGQDLQPYAELMPKNLFMRAIRLGLQYESSALDFSSHPVIQSIVFDGTAVDVLPDPTTPLPEPGPDPSGYVTHAELELAITELTEYIDGLFEDFDPSTILTQANQYTDQQIDTIDLELVRAKDNKIEGDIDANGNSIVNQKEITLVNSADGKRRLVLDPNTINGPELRMMENNGSGGEYVAFSLTSYALSFLSTAFGGYSYYTDPFGFVMTDPSTGVFLQQTPYGWTIVDGANSINFEINNNGIAINGDYFLWPNTAGGGRIASEAFVNALLEGIKQKDPVRAASTANVTLSGLQTLGGVSLIEDDSFLVKDNIDQTTNGIYLVKTGTWVRRPDSNIASELVNALVPVLEGTNASTTYRQSTAPIILGTSNLVFQPYGTLVPDATSSTKGKMKLYTVMGTATDGTITQALITSELELRQLKEVIVASNFYGAAFDNTYICYTNNTNFTDPTTPVVNRGYNILVRDKTITLGAIAQYYDYAFIKRIYTGSAWETKVFHYSEYYENLIAERQEANENVVKILEESPTGQFNSAHGTCVIGNTMFIGTREGASSRLVKYVGTSIQSYQSIPCSFQLGIESLCAHPSGTRIYGIRHFDSVSYIFDVNPANLADINYNVITGVDLGGSPAIVTDGTYIYGISYSAIFFKILIADFSTVLTNDWVGENSGHSALINITDNVAYFGTTTSKLAKVQLSDLTYTAIDISKYVAVMTDDMAFIPNDRWNDFTNRVIVGGEIRSTLSGKGGALIDVDNMTAVEFDLLPTYGIFTSLDPTKVYSASNEGFIEEIDIPLMEANLIMYSKAYFTNTYTFKGSGVPNEILFTADGIFMTNWFADGRLSKIEMTPKLKPVITYLESYYRNINALNSSNYPGFMHTRTLEIAPNVSDVVLSRKTSNQEVVKSTWQNVWENTLKPLADLEYSTSVDNQLLNRVSSGVIQTLINYVDTITSVGFSTTAANSNNQSRFIPFVTDIPISFDEIYIFLAVAHASVTSTVTFYVYDDSNNGLPGIIQHQQQTTAGILTTAPSVITFANNFTLQPGVYWFCLHIRGLDTAGVNPTFNFSPLGYNAKSIEFGTVAITGNFQHSLRATATSSDLGNNPSLLSTAATRLTVPVIKFKTT